MLLDLGGFFFGCDFFMECSAGEIVTVLLNGSLGDFVPSERVLGGLFVLRKERLGGDRNILKSLLEEKLCFLWVAFCCRRASKRSDFWKFDLIEAEAKVSELSAFAAPCFTPVCEMLTVIKEQVVSTLAYAAFRPLHNNIWNEGCGYGFGVDIAAERKGCSGGARDLGFAAFAVVNDGAIAAVDAMVFVGNADDIANGVNLIAPSHSL